MADIMKKEQEAVSIETMEKMAAYLVESRLFGVQNKAQAISLMLIAQAEGMHPAIAARDYHIIQGRHCLKADAMLARFQAAGGKIIWHKYTDEIVAAEFSHPASPKPVLVEWDMRRAKQAGLGDKDNWRKYPRQMLKARVISDGIRLCFPGVAVGIYTPEEAQDFEPVKPEPVKAAPIVQPEEPKSEADPLEPQAEQPVKKATPAQCKLIHARCKAAEVDESKIKDVFGIEHIADLPFVKVNDVLEFIDKNKT